jgi:hypothetical protein
VPVFVSEWGLWGADTDLEAWVKFLKDNQLIWCNWSVNTKDEYSSALKLGASEKGNWQTSNLTDIGLRVRDYIQNWGPAIKQKPRIVYAISEPPFNSVQLHFSEPVTIGLSSVNSFEVFINSTSYNVSSVQVSGVNDSVLNLQLAENAIVANGLKLNYSGDSVIAFNGQILDTILNYNVGIDSLGMPPFVISSECDSFGRYVQLPFNKKMNVVSKLLTGFDVVSDNESILDSVIVSSSDSSKVILYTKKYFKNNCLYLAYTPGTIVASDGGVLDSITSLSILNNSFPEPPGLINAQITSCNKIQLNFDNPVAIKSGINLGLSVIVIDTLGNSKNINIQSTVNNKFYLILTLSDYIGNTDKVYLSYKNGAIVGLRTVYSINDIDSMELTNNLPPVETIQKLSNTKIEAEDYIEMTDVQTETTTDTGGGLNVGYIDSGDWLDYRINVVDTGTYSITFRVAAESTAGNIIVKQTEPVTTNLATIKLPVTGGWQVWQSVTTNVILSNVGEQNIRLNASVGGFNLNWFEFGSPVTSVNVSEHKTFCIYPTFITNRNFNITSNQYIGENLDVSVFSVNGQKVYAEKVLKYSGNVLIYLPLSMKNGMNFVFIKNNNKLVFSGKIVVEK